MAVRHALTSLDGVTDATVSYDDKRADVTHAPSRRRLPLPHLGEDSSGWIPVGARHVVPQSGLIEDAEGAARSRPERSVLRRAVRVWRRVAMQLTGTLSPRGLTPSSPIDPVSKRSYAA